MGLSLAEGMVVDMLDTAAVDMEAQEEDMVVTAVEDMEVMVMVMARDLLSPAEGTVMEDTALDTVMAAIEEDMEVTAGEDMEDTTDVNKKCLNQIEFSYKF